ncbi:MAG: fumarylacetoacetate hydrolase family protein [Clostridiales bacterium]|jgi:2-keto-4-pentenoate hydratase|nr:fumarylacetoacetate hydrolase family protein [Clostridiales bacterium]
MAEGKIKRFADTLYNSERRRESVPPLTAEDPALTIDDAYAIQLCNVDRVVKEGFRISGKKIGLTSPGIQKQLGVNEPDYGHLFSAMESADGKINASHLILPKIEGELAFILKKDLDGGAVTVEDVRAATDYVVAAFEIVDSRVENWNIKLIDTVSDNASSGRYILGEKTVSLDDINPSEVSMKLYKNKKLEQEGTGAAVLGDPKLAVAWLANKLWSYGVTLKKGEVILSGAFSAAPAAVAGDFFEAEFAGLGSVKAWFV